MSKVRKEKERRGFQPFSQRRGATRRLTAEKEGPEEEEREVVTEYLVVCRERKGGREDVYVTRWTRMRSEVGAGR